VYSGVYTVVHSGVTETNGCATLITTLSGGPLNGSTENSLNIDSPQFSQPVNTTFVANGQVSSLTVTGLTASGGSGTLTLSDGSTGTITLTSRTVTTFARVRALINRIRH
jgi:hypothetical protein